jgi:hypothetical protein
MWISKKDEWNPRHTLLSKYFLERIIQLVDYNEIISNRHNTVNGPIIIAEIIELCKSVLLRQKSVNRLKSILKEALEEKISSSLVQDVVFKSDFSDIIQFYKTFPVDSLQNGKRVNEKAIKDLSIKSRVFLRRLETFYFQILQKHILSLDEDPKVFKRNADQLDQLLNCLIPYLLYNGYSATSISEVAIKLIGNPRKNPLERFFSMFNFQKRPFTFLINIGDNENEYNVFLNQLKKHQTSFEFMETTDIKRSIFFKEVEYDPTDKFIRIEEDALDPHSYLTTLYDDCLKYTVIGQDRISLQFYTIFFKYAYWKGADSYKYHPIYVNLDPINTLNRKSTLRTSLATLSKIYNFKFDKTTELPYLEGIEQSVYFYNLALGSKSIENSMSLLWTALESLIPYHPKGNDIDNIQHFVSYFLSVGGIGRQLNSFVYRFRNTNHINERCLTDLGTTGYAHLYSEKGLLQWMDWITMIPAEVKDDPFEKMNDTSVLLCYQYCQLNEKWGGIAQKDGSIVNGKVSHWLSRIEKSQLAIKYQLDRIYSHRNQIVHSGTFINEYSNMWSHLEWYVGKLITYCYLYHYNTGDSSFSKKEVFLALEGEVEHIKNVLQKNKDKDIIAVKDLYPTIFRPIWQFF